MNPIKLFSILATAAGFGLIGARLYFALWRTFKVIGNPHQPFHKRYLGLDMKMWVLWGCFLFDFVCTGTAMVFGRVLMGVVVGVPVGALIGLFASFTITISPWMRAIAIDRTKRSA